MGPDGINLELISSEALIRELGSRCDVLVMAMVQQQGPRTTTRFRINGHPLMAAELARLAGHYIEHQFMAQSGPADVEMTDT